MANTVLYTPKDISVATLSVFDSNGLLGVYKLGLHTRLGRQGCDITLNSPIVSRSHGEIVFMQDKFWYRDVGSTNGTYVNREYYGKRSPDGKFATVLSDGDVIRITSEGGNPTNKITAIFSGGIKDGSEWMAMPLTDDIAEICIGRAPAAGLHIENDMISEKHASFFHAKSGWALIDHNSTNGVFVNGKRMGQPRYLTPMEAVRIADVFFVYYDGKLFYSSGALGDIPKAEENIKDPASDAPAKQTPPPKENAKPGNAAPQLYINIVERSVSQRFRKMMLLQNINLSVNAGEMILILGGSGAGKTTFINAVMGYEKALGTIVYKNTDIYREYESMKYEIGFVPQQDLLRDSDTVYDTVANAAEMKLPISVSEQERRMRVNAVMDELGLTREANSLVSKLSGGQRKRLSIAVELIADPGLFFLDEPDSGIDDIMGRAIMENLRKIADRGKIVMIITHSPERAADLFDKIIVLAKSAKDNCGHLAFYGNPDEAKKFFDTDSFRGILKKINRKDENGEGLSDYYIDKYNSTKR